MQKRHLEMGCGNSACIFKPETSKKFLFILSFKEGFTLKKQERVNHRDV